MLTKFGNSFIQIQHAQIRLNSILEQFYSYSLQKCKNWALIN